MITRAQLEAAVEALALALRFDRPADTVLHEFFRDHRALGSHDRAFVADARHRASGPVIARFRAELEAAQAAELARLYDRLPSLDERSRTEIRRFADRLLGKVLHPPLESLRDASRNGSPHGLLEALQRLFQLKD